MSEASITTIVTGLVTIAIAFFGFLTLWVKLRYGVAKAEEAATRASVVEGKIDSNTQLTQVAKDTADSAGAEKLELLHKIETQTNGGLTAMRYIVADLVSRVTKLETYHQLNTDVLTSLTALNEKVSGLTEVPPKHNAEADHQ